MIFTTLNFVVKMCFIGLEIKRAADFGFDIGSFNMFAGLNKTILHNECL